MPLISLASLHWYGPGVGAMVVSAPASVVAEIKATARAGAVGGGLGSMPLAKATRLVGSPAIISGTGSMPRALPKATARAGALIRVGALSQDDVTGAVLESAVEPGVTLRQAIRALLAVAAGKTDITDLGGGAATVKFRDVNDTKDRVTATMAGSERTAVSKDLT